MANDNRKLPHRHDPELARKEALQARQTHTHRSGQKESGHRQTTSRVNKRPSTHSSATSRRKNIKKNSRYQQVRRQKMMLAGGGFLILLLVITSLPAPVFLPEKPPKLLPSKSTGSRPGEKIRRNRKSSSERSCFTDHQCCRRLHPWYRRNL